MKIAICHYHLKTGGVTTVIKQQLQAINNERDILILSGEKPEASFPVDTVYIPGLGYDKPTKKKIKPETVAQSIINAIYSKWKQGCDVLHVHNPTLAKNSNLQQILEILQNNQIKLFLQIHDFCEDGRALECYFKDEYISNCHYGVINSRDYHILLKASLKKEGVHKIFNTVTPFNLNNKNVKIENRVLYPIRAIRRKNIGEAILLSIFFKEKERLTITLPPNSDTDLISYNAWKKFVKENNLNVEFEAGLTNNFAKLIQSSKFIITTSLSEGFGFSFLEPWTAKKILWGRKLPEICNNFESKGIELKHLYTSLLVPVSWIGRNNLYNKFRKCILNICEKFNYFIDEKTINKAFNRHIINDNIDFALLDEVFQKQIIINVLSNRKNFNKLTFLNPYMANPGHVADQNILIQNNMDIILSQYNLKTYKEKLLSIYSIVKTKPVIQKINKQTLLSQFLNINKFSMLKWNDYVE